MISRAVAVMPPLPLNMPENDLHPDPARLREDIKGLCYRVTDLERRITVLEQRR